MAQKIQYFSFLMYDRNWAVKKQFMDHEEKTTNLLVLSKTVWEFKKQVEGLIPPLMWLKQAKETVIKNYGLETGKPASTASSRAISFLVVYICFLDFDYYTGSTIHL